MSDKGQDVKNSELRKASNTAPISDFVLEKSIFSNIFDKDIRRVYIYKKTERLAKAIHLITPAFKHSNALRDRVDKVAIGLVDAAILPPLAAREALSRELLALSSVLSIARTGGLLSDMNAELISREAHALLQEVAAYEEPRLFLDHAPTLAELAKDAAGHRETGERPRRFASLPAARQSQPAIESNKGQDKGHALSLKSDNTRKTAIVDVLRSKGPSRIKDISTTIRTVSEKTIQRELAALVQEGLVSREGERRWTVYELRA